MVIEVPALRTLDDLSGLVRTMRERRPELEVDLRGLAGSGDPRYVRFDADVVATFAQLLLTVRSQAALTVWLPQHPALLRQLVRAGVLFALGQRAGRVVAYVGEAPAPDVVGSWRGNWNPHGQGFRQSLGSSAQPASDESPLGDIGQPISAGHVIFKNPHLAVMRERLAVEVSDNVAVPWVKQVVRAASPSSHESWVEMFGDAAGSVIRELLFNLAVHPFASLAGVPDPPRENRRAYVSLFSTKGGGSESHNRVHMIVADTGHGISRTLRPKLRQLGSETADLDSDRLVAALMAQELPAYGHAEGFGFGRILELADRFKGSLHLLTGADDAFGGSIVATFDGDTKVKRLQQFDCRGTIAHAVLSVEGAPMKEEQPQLFSGVRAG